MRLEKGSFMKSNKLIWIVFLPLFLFFFLMFYVEVATYSLLPYEHGGMSFWVELKNIWYQSVWFYAMLVIISLMIYFILQKRK